MSIKATSPVATGERPAVRSGLRWPEPATLALLLLLVIAMIVASLAGLALGTV